MDVYMLTIAHTPVYKNTMVKRRVLQTLTAAACVFWIVYTSLRMLMAPGARIIYNFCGNPGANTTGIAINGCALNETGPFSFFLSTDPFPYLHTTFPFLFGVFCASSAAGLLDQTARIIAGAVLYETFEAVLGRIASPAFREVSGDSVIGDMSMATLGAGILAGLQATGYIPWTPGELWRRRKWQRWVRGLLLLGLFLAQAVSTFEVVVPGMPGTGKLGFFVYFNLQILWLMLMWRIDVGSVRGSETKKKEVDWFYLTMLLYAGTLWGSCLALTGYTYVNVIVGNIVFACFAMVPLRPVPQKVTS